MMKAAFSVYALEGRWQYATSTWQPLDLQGLIEVEPPIISPFGPLICRDPRLQYSETGQGLQ